MNLSAKAQNSLDNVIAKFQAGDLSPVSQVLALTLPEDAPARQWSLSNRVMALAQTGSLDCRGYRQWQAAGRQVTKGAQAGFILTPRVVTKDKGAAEERRIVIGFISVAVFGIDATEGEEIADYRPAQLPPLMDVAERLGVDVGYMPLFGYLGYCMLDNSKIRLATHEESVFFHELAHAAHNTVAQTVGGQNSHQETVAELTACILMDLHGLKDTTGNAWQYIAGYNADPLKAIMRALSDVEKVLGVIFPQS